MKFIISIIRNIFLFPHTILNKTINLFNKNTQNYGNESPKIWFESYKYMISILVWIIFVYLISRSILKYNRIVYACPLDYSLPCKYVEAQFETICDKENGCFRYYSKIIFSNRKVINFSYCDMIGIAVYNCYTDDKQETWRLEYLGNNVVRKE